MYFIFSGEITIRVKLFEKRKHAEIRKSLSNYDMKRTE